MIIEARGLTKSFQGTKGRISVLNGLDMNVARGEVLSIVGASGVGKSTLLQILGSLDRADEGTLRIKGQRVEELKGAALNRLRNQLVGFVFQFHFLLPEFTALENVMMPALVGGGTMKSAMDRAEALLVRVGLADRMQHRPSELSGGEQQRVAVARALTNDPEVIFADEPTGNLDDATSEEVHELIGDLAKEDKKTFVVVTHKKEFADYAHRVEVLRDGVLYPDQE